MSLPKPTNLDHARAAETVEMIHSWYEIVARFLEKEVPCSNHTEPTTFTKLLLTIKKQITVMEGFKAFGDYIPPMILFPGKDTWC